MHPDQRNDSSTPGARAPSPTSISAVDVHVIALQRETERRARIRDNLERLGVTYRFLDGVDARELDDAAVVASGYDQACAEKAFRRQMARTEIACFMSHRLAWKAIAESDRPGLVLEADMLLEPEAPGVIASALEVPVWEHLMLFYDRCNPSLWKRCVLTPTHRLVKFADRRVYCAGAYLLRPEAARKLLHHSASFYLTADDFLTGGWLDKDVELYALHPPVARPGPEAEASTIGSQRVDLQKTVARRNKNNSRWTRRVEFVLRDFFRRVRRPAKGL